MKKAAWIVLVALGALSAPTTAGAVVQNLNGLTASSQTFVNDANVTVTSTGSTHTFVWSGILSPARGGTGVSSFATGSVPFFLDGIFKESAGFVWDNLNSLLTVQHLKVSSSTTFLTPLTPSSGGTGQSTYAKGDILVAQSSSTLGKLSVGSDGKVLTASSSAPNGVSWETPVGGAGAEFFGDGSDGAATISTNTTLTRDMFYDTLAVSSGAKITTGGYRIYVRNTLTINNGATVDHSGGSGGIGVPQTPGSGGTAAAGGTLSAGSAGVSGGFGNSTPGQPGAGGVGAHPSLGAAGAAGGNGGNGVNGGGTGGIAGTLTAENIFYIPSGYPQYLSDSGTLTLSSSTSFADGGTSRSRLSPPAGSGSGGGGGGCGGGGCWGGGGGGSGASGGIVEIIAKNIVNNGTISANGGTGGNGGGGVCGGSSTGGGGGGGGGSGGVTVLAYITYSGTGNIAVNAGSGGIGGVGCNGGTAGANGNNGNLGKIYRFVLPM